jgi:hypothetical protein
MAESTLGGPRVRVSGLSLPGHRRARRREVFVIEYAERIVAPLREVARTGRDLAHAFKIARTCFWAGVSRSASER